MAGPLAGLKVLELGTLIAGPFAARMFAEFGADVIKVEDPRGGDPIRNWRYLHEGTSLWWYVQSRNKRSITLNLKDSRGQAIARSLALDADVIVENYRPGVLEKWGLGYEALRANNPAAIMVRISGYGQTGPMRDMPGFGAIGESMGGTPLCVRASRPAAGAHRHLDRRFDRGPARGHRRINGAASSRCDRRPRPRRRNRSSTSLCTRRSST